MPKRALAVQLESETVALVRIVDEDGSEDLNGKPAVYCAGVFVSQTVILTAGHCVDTLGMDPMRRLLHRLEADADLPRWNPVGQTGHFALQGFGERWWNATVIADDYDVDLGALRVNADAPWHTFARVSAADIYDGQAVEVVGHPIAFEWSYAEGVVSGVRDDDRNPFEHKALTLQLNVAIAPGNSGGGAFDRDGGLLGIASFGHPAMPGYGFFVHRDSVRTFLARLP